jgi:hypothetical protein
LLKELILETLLTSLKNPCWANAERTAINCEITTSQFGDEVLFFTASPNDIEAHGRAIYADIIAGTYGEIVDYVPQPEVQNPTATLSSGTIQGSIL